MKVILEYYDMMRDGKTVNQILAKKNIHIVKTFPRKNYHRKIKIETTCWNQLHTVLAELNSSCENSVNIIKVKS